MGPDAAEAARRAVAVFEASRDRSPAALVSEIHGALRSTRGAAVAIASLDHEIGEIRYAGVGNIAGTIVHGGATRSMVSLNGTVGHEMRKVQEFAYEWPAGALVVMHSDGLQTHWRLDKYPGLAARHPNVIAAVLYRDFSRGRDDLTVLAAAVTEGGVGPGIVQSIITVDLSHEGDVVVARRRARQIADVLGLDAQDQSRFATAVSEIARNAFQYAGGGRAEFGLEDTPIRMLTVRLTDRGPGIGDLRAILDGRYVSHTGMGVGISGARRLTDHFEIRSAPGQGTTVVLGKRIPSRSPRITPMTAAQVSAKLQTGGDLDFGQELREQNKELMRSLEETRGRQVEIERLNRELEETNRGVVALYMELDERALDLARTADMKSRILSDISHEVRTPLNAILNISRLLMDRMDGDLSPEQERQIRMIRDSAMTVTELVSDLLELARMEAGKTLARVSTFSLGDLFAGLRGMFRPLATSDAVSVVFEDVGNIPELQTDEGKIGQVLRNLISNALKFTERGEIRVKATIRGRRRHRVHGYRYRHRHRAREPRPHLSGVQPDRKSVPAGVGGRGPRVAAVPEARDLSRRQPDGHQ